MARSRVRLLGESVAMRRLRDQLLRVASTPLPVLLCGETGTGKEVAARFLHDASGRTGAFIPVDCAAMSSSLVETELFGYERGAFTGATHRRDGLVHAARGGTFFLDEVGELSLDVQTRLLRLLEQATYRPVGAQNERPASIRVVAATWRDLRAAVNLGTFRRDLYHRLTIVELVLPPLRERLDDLEPLLGAFMEEDAEGTGRTPPILEATVRSHLQSWPWPGNIRELRNVASYIVAMTRGPRVRYEDLPASLRRAPPDVATAHGPTVQPPIAMRVDLPYMEARRLWLDDFQQRYVESILEANGGNVSAAARAAGMDRRSIQRILARYRPEDTSR